MTRAWAAFNLRGDPMVRTVHDSPRGAKVNWLYSHTDIMVRNDFSDELIGQLFDAHSPKYGVTIHEVTISKKEN